MRPAAHWILTAALLLCSTGCNWLTPLIFIGEHKKEITAEFDKLPGTRVVVLVWAPPETRFDYPHVRLELATHVADKLAAEMKTKQQKVDLVDPVRVEDFLQRNYDAQVSPNIVGVEFEADYVIYLELLEFQFRDPDRPQFLQGQIESSVVVHEVGKTAAAGKSLELMPVRAIYPETPILLGPTNAPAVRWNTYLKFAEEVARKFYDYTVDL